MHRAVRGTRLAEGRDRLLAGLSTLPPGAAAEEVAVEAVADLGDGLPGHQRRRPAVLADDVVDQVADGPVGAEGVGPVPRVLGDGADALQEQLDRAGVQAQHIGVVGHAGDRAPAGAARPALAR